MSISSKGKKTWNKGVPATKEHKEKLINNHWSKKENANKIKGIISEKGKVRKPWNYLDGRSKYLPPARYGDDWNKIRNLIYVRDNYICQNCGIGGKPIVVHHIIPFLETFDNSLNNLITLCRTCHNKIECEIIKGVKCR